MMMNTTVSIVALILCLLLAISSITSALQLPLRSFSVNAYSLCFQPDGTLVTKGQLNDTIDRWDVSGTGAPILLSSFKTNEPNDVRITSDDDGFIYVPLYTIGAVIKLDVNGTSIVGIYRTLIFPYSIAVGKDEVYVSDTLNANNLTILSKSSMSEIITVTLALPDSDSFVGDLNIDSTGTQLFVAVPTGILRFTTRGVRTGFWPIPAPRGFAYFSLAIDRYDNLYFLTQPTDESIEAINEANATVYKLNKQGTIASKFTLTAQNPSISVIRSIAVSPITNNLWITDDQSYIAGFVREYASNTAQCTTGPAAGLFDLNLISPAGTDIQGINNARTYEFVWNVCGNVTEDLCEKFASGSSLCALNLPTTSGVIVARPPPTDIKWTIVTPTNTTAAGVNGVVMNGDQCGRYNLPSLLIIILSCADIQDKTFLIDDSQVSPLQSVCTYVLTFHTPVVCTPTAEQRLTQWRHKLHKAKSINHILLMDTA